MRCSGDRLSRFHVFTEFPRLKITNSLNLFSKLQLTFWQTEDSHQNLINVSTQGKVGGPADQVSRAVPLVWKKRENKTISISALQSNSSLLISPKYVQFNILKMCWQLNPFNGTDNKQTISNLVNKHPQETGFI